MPYRVAAVLLILAGLGQQVQAAEESFSDSLRKYRFLASSGRRKAGTAFDRAEAARQAGEAAEVAQLVAEAQQAARDAIAYYHRYLELRPDDSRAHFHLGDLYFRSQDIPRAREELHRALALDSLHVNTNLRLYSIYLGEGRPDSAVLALERVLRDRPDDAGYRRRLADLYRREGELEKALGHYEPLVDQAEDREQLIELVAVLHEDLGHADRALAWRQRLLEGESPRTPEQQRDALETLVRLQLQTGDLESAFRSLLQLAAVDTLNRYSYYSQIATLAGENDRERMQARGWEGMVEANPRDLETVGRLVEYYLGEDEPERARRWIQQGLRVSPSDAHLQLLKGDLLVQTGDADGAVVAYQKAMSDRRWESVAQQRIWEIRPPETEEEKLKRAFFGRGREGNGEQQD
ncbi:MAG: tetratricopeptide repeat protein [Candidatus Latescibacterota bacterium]